MRHVIESYVANCNVHGELRTSSSRLGAEQVIEEHLEYVSYNEAEGGYRNVPCRCHIITEYTWEWD